VNGFIRDEVATTRSKNRDEDSIPRSLPIAATANNSDASIQMRIAPFPLLRFAGRSTPGPF